MFIETPLHVITAMGCITDYMYLVDLPSALMRWVLRFSVDCEPLF